ncbi:fibronectin type III domain-containing protein, partial [archaeon]
VTVDLPLSTSSGPVTTLQVSKLEPAVPEFSVKTAIEGEDSYTYEIYFSGSHHSSIGKMGVYECDSFKQYEGMRFGLASRVIQEGGSQEQQILQFSSLSIIEPNDNNRYWKLAANGVVLPTSPSLGFMWGEDASTISAEIFSSLGLVAHIVRRGFGSKEESFGFSYTVTFDDSADDVPQLEVLVDGQWSKPVFTSSNVTFAVDDLSVTGSYDGVADAEFRVKITSVGAVDKFAWSINGGVFSSSVTIVANQKFLLQNGLYINFDSQVSHILNDEWSFTAIRVSKSLPPKSFTVSSTFIGGTLLENAQVLVSPGYVGTSYEVLNVYKSPALFVVQDQSIEIRKVVVVDSSSSLQYVFESEWIVNSTMYRIRSSCLSANAADFVIENELNNLFVGFCSDSAPCVTVTRDVDSINYPGGFIYSVYLENSAFYDGMHHFDITLNVTACSNTPAGVSMTTDQQSLFHLPLTRSFIPISPIDDATTLGLMSRRAVERAPLFKVNGNLWIVTFATNIGDIPALQASGNSDLSASTDLVVYDDVVRGEHPLSHLLTNLNTGIQYFARIAAYTRGTNRGYGNYEPASFAQGWNIPATVPPPIENFIATAVLNTNAVQKVVVGASHVREVQTITTSAASYAEVQNIVITSPEGQTVDGMFTMRFAEVQTVEFRASGSSGWNNFFALTYSYFDFSQSPSLQLATTHCLSVQSSAIDVKEALESISVIDRVDVSRSGYGGYTDYFGYKWSVTFSGNLVAGDVQMLSVTYGTNASSCSSTTQPANALILVSTVNDGRIGGLDTEVQTVTIQANKPFIEGAYRLDFDGALTSCIDWRASAQELQDALEALNNIDKVFVERYGNGGAQSNFGFTYSVFFTGNALHVRDQISIALPALIVDMNDISCDPFAYFENGMRLNFTSSAASVTVQEVRKRGFTLDATNTPANVLASALLEMPSFLNVYDIRRSLADDRRGFQWAMIYDLSMGNVPQIVCGGDQQFTASGATCTTSTLIDGNYIGGYFIVDNSKPLPSDISAENLVLALQILDGFGNVSVSRSVADGQGGFVWSVTWLTRTGDVPEMKVTSLLTGAAVKLYVTTIHDGNYLNGGYRLQYRNQVSTSIPYNATVAEFGTLLQPLLGSISVSRKEFTTEGGSSYYITFLSDYGPMEQLVPEYAGTLLGQNAVVHASTVVKGVRASGSSLSTSYSAPTHCSYSQVLKGYCGAPVESYVIEVGDTQGSVIQKYEIPADYGVQIVSTSALSLFDPVYFTGEDASGFFRLSYRGEMTGPISAHASALDLRDALEALPSVQTVNVARDLSVIPLEVQVIATPGKDTLTCASAACDFSLLPPGDILRVNGLWYRVRQSYDGSSSDLPLARLNDSSIPDYFPGANEVTVPMYRWARGFEWSVTFLKVVGDVQHLESPPHDLNPLDATLSIRIADCLRCHYISQLAVFNTYTLRVSARNVRGYGPLSVSLGTPRQIPNAPNAVSVTTLSGTQLEVYFSPPSGVISDIEQYTIQWDENPTFSRVLSEEPSCGTYGYGQCQLQGSILNVVPPYRYIINHLTIDTRYYVRVAARNEISFLVLSTSSNPDEVTNWSNVVSAVTANQVPTAPVGVSAAISSPTSLQLLITPPTSDGGLAVTNYIIEWDISSSFSPTTRRSVKVQVSALPLLRQSTGVLVYELTSLITGTTYWVRVAAENSIGAGSFSMASQNLAPSGKPGSPASVRIDTPTSLTTPITTSTVSWTPPSTDNGAPITNYMVEWWEGGYVPEVQVIQFTSTSFPLIANGNFTLSFGPQPNVKESTSVLKHSSSAFNIRSELMNLGYTVGMTNNFNFNFVIGDVNVSRSVIPRRGYQWSVTFLSETNLGNQVSLVANSLAAESDGESIQVFEVTPGSRPGGTPEVQIVSILAAGSTSADDLGGWFRLSFNGSENMTTYLKVSSSKDEVKTALLQLGTLRALDINRQTVQRVVAGVNYAGYEWTITFTENVADQPALQLDSDLVFTNRIGLQVAVIDGDNALVQGSKAFDTYPGEAPKNYNARLMGKDDRDLTITNLRPGNTYFIAVTAVNLYGNGPRALPAPSFTSLAKQAPQPPTQVSLDIHSGSATTLDISYAPPLSDGGAPVIAYRVELDVNTGFQNPIVSTVPCPTSNVRSVFQVRTQGYANDPIVDGFFTLTFRRGHATFVTDLIPYDATAMLADETGVAGLVQGLTVSLIDSSDQIVASVNATELLFPGDVLSFPDHQLYPQQLFVVLQVIGTSVQLDQQVSLVTPTASSVVMRTIGGRGQTTTSKVTCVADSVLCPTDRRQLSGSMQAKFQSLNQAVFNGVKVDRNEPDEMNGVTWRITFLDDSLPGSLNFDLSLTPGSNQVVTQSGAEAMVTVTELVVGETFSACTGRFEVPGSKSLAVGRIYYARVFAINEVGYSLPQIAPAGQKPQVVPGPPTAVVLSVVSETELRVRFNQPIDDGGDTVTSYRVEYSPNSNFLGAQSVLLQNVRPGGAPYAKVISGLTTGTFYFVRVSAGNSLGYGNPTSSIPPSLNPYKASAAPSGVRLLVTSDSMLTVSFSDPADNGGDAIKKFVVEWDISPTFTSLASAPHKGSFDLDASTDRSYTIRQLTRGQVYYARVFAVNSAGAGAPALSSPPGASPALQVPGRPQTISARSGSLTGEVVVSWQEPRIPWHNVPCRGLPSRVEDCPRAVDNAPPASNGGSDITEYEVSYNNLADFTGLDGGSFTVTASSRSYTVRNLTPDRLYYIRVLARNAQGAGSFCRFIEPNCLVASTRITAVAKA